MIGLRCESFHTESGYRGQHRRIFVSKLSAFHGRKYAIAIASIIATITVVAVLAFHPTPRVAAASTSPFTHTSSLQFAVPPVKDRARVALANLPLNFEQNEGQADAQVRYITKGPGYTLQLAAAGATFKLHKRGADSEVRNMLMNRRIGPAAVKKMLRQRSQDKEKSKSLTAEVQMRTIGASPSVKAVAQDPQAGKVNYLLGKDPSRWHANVPLFGQVSYQNLYPGIDLVFHGSGKQLEFDYCISAGADANRIAVSFDGAQSLQTNAAGDLSLATSAGQLEIHKPVAYQETAAGRQLVNAGFKKIGANQISFILGPYDHTRELIIDPTVTYSTYFGGDFADYGLSIAVDASGNEYVTGATDSDTIPGDSSARAGSFDVFVTEIGSAGQLVFSTTFGGSGDEFPGGIAVDSAGIYVSGTTDSSDFPTTPGAAQPTFLGGSTNGDNDAFAVNLALNGSSLAWATYVAGSDSDSGLAVAVDSGHNVYVVGETFSDDLGRTAVAGVPFLPNGGAVNLGSGSGADDGYIVKINASGSSYALISYIGGSSGDLATGVALDGSGNIYVSGETISTDLPVTTGVVQTQCGTDGSCNAAGNGGNPQDDAFIAGISANLSNYTYLTYYGGSSFDDAFAIAADAAGNSFITGTTASTDFPTAGTPFQSTLASGATQNAFVVELNSTGTTANYGTYLGGNDTDFGLGIAVDATDNVYVTGQTLSSNFPTFNPTQPSFGGSSDAFVTMLTPNQTGADFSTFLGGSGEEDQLGGEIALDSALNIYVTGDTTSGNSLNGATTTFPTVNALDGTYGGNGPCPDSLGDSVPCTDAFITAYTTPSSFSIAAGAANPSSVNAGSTATSAITIAAINGYSNAVNLTCSVSGGGSPAPTCAFNPTSVTGSGSSTLTISTTGAAASLVRPSKLFYAMWLPIAGLALVGMSFSSARTRRRKMLGFLMVEIVMLALFMLPACGGGSNNNGGGGGGQTGCTGCTPSGTYNITVTGVGSDAAATTHSTSVTLTVN
jgi:hypothetical protein